MIHRSETEPDQGGAKYWFYGWVMLPLAILVMAATSPGQTYGIAFFNQNFRVAFDLSHTRLSAIYLAASLIAAMMLPMVGGVIDRYGLRRSAIFVVTMMASACLFASQVQGTVTLLVAFLLLRALGSGTMVLVANNTLAAWFDRRLGMAIGLMQVAMAIAMAVVPTGIVALIEAFGWRGAYIVLAAILAGGLLPLVVFAYRQSPSDVGQFPDGQRCDAIVDSQLALRGVTLGQATSQPAYWILLATTGMWGMAGSGLLFHVEAMFRVHQLGLQESTRAISYLAVAMATMQIFGGMAADRLPMRWLVVTALGLLAGSNAVLALDSPRWLTTGYVVYGLAHGLLTIIAGTAWARFFGRAHLGKIRGTSITAGVGASSVGPLILGLSIDYLGSFTPALWLLAACSAAVCIAALWAKPPPGTHCQ